MKFHKLFEEEPEPEPVDRFFWLTAPEKIMAAVLMILVVALMVVIGQVSR